MRVRLRFWTVSSISASVLCPFSNLLIQYILHPINYLFTYFIRDVSTIHFLGFNLLLLRFLMSACWSVHNIHQKVIQSKFLRRGLLIHKNCKVTGWDSFGKCLLLLSEFSLSWSFHSLCEPTSCILIVFCPLRIWNVFGSSFWCCDWSSSHLQYFLEKFFQRFHHWMS